MEREHLDPVLDRCTAAYVNELDEDAEIDPVPGDGGGGRPEPELDRLSNIIAEFNDLFGGIEWENEDRVRRMITSDIPAGVAFEQTYGPGSAT